MREIKFRAWHRPEAEMIDPVEFHQIMGGWESAMLDDWLNSPTYLVMQFTGLKDKNGKEIYEGDIVEKTMRRMFHVKWNSGSGGWGISNSQGRFGSWDSLSDCNDKVFIIGNIHENPELL